jgi:hypothetical protein
MPLLSTPNARHVRLVTLAALVALAALSVFGCQDKAKVSAERAKEHVAFVVKSAAEDLREVRSGLPAGTEHLTSLFSSGKPLADDPKAAEDALFRARNRVQDLRTAKSTFFAIVDQSGLIIRNDQEQDLMAGKNLFASFPELKGALAGKYVEARGSMPEASGVKGRKDAQWAAAAPVTVDGQVKGLYATGWSWSGYAYRLENALRTRIRGELKEHEKTPLVYAFVVVDGAVYAAPVTPDVSIEQLSKQGLLQKAQPGQTYTGQIEITGRDFGLAAAQVPEFGPGVVVAVLRSET